MMIIININKKYNDFQDELTTSKTKSIIMFFAFNQNKILRTLSITFISQICPHFYPKNMFAEKNLYFYRKPVFFCFFLINYFCCH